MKCHHYDKNEPHPLKRLVLLLHATAYSTMLVNTEHVCNTFIYRKPLCYHNKHISLLSIFL